MEDGRIIVEEWGLDAGLHSKEEILAALARRIDELLSQDPVAFIQLMYRLDIPEARVDVALDMDNAAAMIAELVWDRQVHKSMLRRNTPPRSSDDTDLFW